MDIVIMWVDGADPYFEARHDDAISKLAAKGITVQSQKGRHRDNGELFFLLRAISKYMPWYRKIYIVTNGQTPKYVDFSRDDIEMVTHADIFPRAEDAPGFNTFAIESAINNIKGLSEHYIRFSDDFFVGSSLTQADFLGPEGHGAFYFGGQFFNMRDTAYHRTLQYNAVKFWESFGYLPLMNTLHVPQLRKRTYVSEMLSLWSGWFFETQASKFRTEKDAIGLFLYPYFVIEKYMDRNYEGVVQSIFAKQNKGEGKPTYRQVNLGGNNVDWMNRVENIQEARPKFFNLNDTMPDKQVENVVQSVSTHLYEIYPDPSPFEILGSPLPPFASGSL